MSKFSWVDLLSFGSFCLRVSKPDENESLEV